MMILGVLVAKSFRVSVIFGSKLLIQIRAVTDLYVGGIVSFLLLTQVVMLIIFNSLQMTYSDLQSDGTNTVVWGCSTANGFNAWMGVEIGIFALVMVAGAVVAFRTRSVPSAFNESSHILFSLQILLFMLVILVPLDWALINNSPEASIVIQAGGQLLLSFFILLANFTPKLFYLFSGRGNDKSMVFQASNTSTIGNASSLSANSSHGNSSHDGQSESVAMTRSSKNEV